jgi:hypothetical protein
MTDFDSELEDFFTEGEEVDPEDEAEEAEAVETESFGDMV